MNGYGSELPGVPSKQSPFVFALSPKPGPHTPSEPFWRIWSGVRLSVESIALLW